MHQYRATGRTAYLADVKYTTIVEVLQFGPVGAFYFLYSPMLWMIDTVPDVVITLQAVGSIALTIAALWGGSICVPTRIGDNARARRRLPRRGRIVRDRRCKCRHIGPPPADVSLGPCAYSGRSVSCSGTGTNSTAVELRPRRHARHRTGPLSNASGGAKMLLDSHRQIARSTESRYRRRAWDARRSGHFVGTSAVFF